MFLRKRELSKLELGSFEKWKFTVEAQALRNHVDAKGF